MKKGTMIVLVYIPLALGILFGVAKVLPILRNKAQKATSDAKDMKGTMNVALDDWIGYFPLNSLRMKKDLRNQGYVLNCVNDGGDYTSRMRKLKDGELDFAVVTVDSYILNGITVDYPGTIIAVLDESKGGDAMVAYTNVVQNLDSFKGTNIPVIAYTPGSPSHHLLKTIGAHFNILGLGNLPTDKKIETKDSQEALKLLQNKKVSSAVLWEPNVSKALEIPGVGKIIGTENMSGVIVDILVVNRDFAASHPEQVDLLLRTYFRILKFYSDDPDQLKRDVASEIKVQGDSIQKMLDGVAWVNLSDNCRKWFGIGSVGQVSEQLLVDVIESTTSVLIETGDFKSSPLPDKDPYRIINKRFIGDIYESGIKNGFANVANASGVIPSGVDHVFKILTEEQWQKLRSVGSIKVDPIKFQTGLAELDVSEKEKLDAAVERLKHYPTFRILIGGHTTFGGDAEANKTLSQQRADSVARYLMVTYNIDQNRIQATGFGGGKPLPRQPGESDRAYNYRLPRVELSLMEDPF
jgi:outer membrane protein OmpA-like peptidoglycan-associated protein